MPEVLEPRDLMINKDKSEQHLLNRTNPKWRKSKYLGSMPETNKDTKRRKVLAVNQELFSITRNSLQKQK